MLAGVTHFVSSQHLWSLFVLNKSLLLSFLQSCKKQSNHKHERQLILLQNKPMCDFPALKGQSGKACIFKPIFI